MGSACKTVSVLFPDAPESLQLTRALMGLLVGSGAQSAAAAGKGGDAWLEVMALDAQLHAASHCFLAGAHRALPAVTEAKVAAWIAAVLAAGQRLQADASVSGEIKGVHRAGRDSWEAA